MTSARVSLSDAQEVAAALADDVSVLVRRMADPLADAIGVWVAADVAAHLVHVTAIDLSSIRGSGPEAYLAGKGIPAPRSVADVRHMTDALLDADPIREPSVHADRFDANVAAMARECALGDGPEVAWLLGLRLPRAAVWCHLLYEMALHGGDIARSQRVRWRVSPDVARLALDGFVVPALRALAPAAAREARVTAATDVRLRGGGRFALGLTSHGIVVDPPVHSVDLHVSIDPVAMLVAMSGRGGSRVQRLLTGRVLVWGRRPRRGLSVFQEVHAP